MDFDLERLFKQSVIVCFIDRSYQFADSGATEDRQFLFARLRLRRPLCSEQEVREATAVIKMQMTDPNRIEIGPVKIFLRHAVRGVTSAIKQQRSCFGLQPESRRRAFWVRH